MRSYGLRQFVGNNSHFSYLYFYRVEHTFTQEPDFFTTTGIIQNVTDEIPTPTDDHGSWGFNNGTKTLTYLVSGKDADLSVNNNPATRDVSLKVSYTRLCVYMMWLISHCVTNISVTEIKDTCTNHRVTNISVTEMKDTCTNHRVTNISETEMQHADQT